MSLERPYSRVSIKTIHLQILALGSARKVELIGTIIWHSATLFG